MNRKSLAAAAALAVFSTAPAFADAQPYVSVGFGGSHADIDCTGADSCKNTATAAKAIVGYDFGNTLAVEGMYVSLGKPKASVDGIEGGIRSDYWGLGGAWRPAINAQWSFVTRLGVAFANSRIEAAGFDGQSFHSTQAYFGIGAAYAINRNLKLEADFDSTQIQINDQFGDKAQSRVVDYTLGVTYGF